MEYENLNRNKLKEIMEAAKAYRITFSTEPWKEVSRGPKCDYFGIDPYASISEGTMIASCRPHKAEAVVKALAKKGIKSSVVGELIDAKKGMILVEDGKEKELKHPIVDPFWRAFYDAMAKG